MNEKLRDETQFDCARLIGEPRARSAHRHRFRGNRTSTFPGAARGGAATAQLLDGNPIGLLPTEGAGYETGRPVNGEIDDKLNAVAKLP